MILIKILMENILKGRNTCFLVLVLCVSNLFSQTADQRAENVQDAANAIFMSSDKSYYKHNSASDNDPYGYGYWTQAHTLETLADAYQRTRSAVYKDRMKNIIAGIRKYNLYEQGTYRNDYYDDLEWLCLASFNCYNATKDQEFLDAVHQIWGEIKTGYANGAIAWKKGCSTACNNSISNGPAIVIAVKLYQLEGDNANLQMAKDIHAWMKTNVFNAQGGIWDSPSNFDQGWQFSYNSGMFIAACLELSIVTGEQSYIDDGIKASDFMMNYRKYNGGAFYLNETGQGDGGLFKGIFAKWFIEFVRIGNIPQARKEHYLQIINYTADYVWSHAVDKSNFLTNYNWKKLPAESIDLSTHTSGLHLFESAASLNKVHVYQDLNYAGFYSQLSPGDYTSAQLLSRGVPDNFITSLTIPLGYEVTVYENDNFTGESQIFTTNTASLADWSDKISSIKIIDRNPPVTNPIAIDSSVMNVFQGADFTGYNVALDIGDYTLAQLQSKGILDNDISSFKLSKGFKVTLYEGDNFTGESKDFTSDNVLTADWNNKATSLRIRANGDVNLGGVIYNLQNRNSNLNMDVWGSSLSNGGIVAQAVATAEGNQKFAFTHLGDGLYKITAEHSGQSLNIDDYSSDNGTAVNQYPYNAAPNQQFVLVSTGDGYYKIIPRISGKLVEVSDFSSADGAKVQQWEDVNSQASGQWKLIKVGSLGVETQNKIPSAVYLYPNPAENTLFFNTDIKGSNVSVFSSAGSLVLKQNIEDSNTVDISRLQAGTYFITVNKEGKKVTKKFFKK
ncbi:glycoside hydrolase family 76 protein [Flavobacterium aquicola]|uniref:Putative secreted protein (Por secretion system target) n=1 Tax=Flavobacterium aquicola TaxID=1682742 RepID=A0A3E0EC21_9FLAO|nr:glycoside hydrolase family 76 protein [Flavobacterium aquicola]REG94779.1 putative secreted protein (Por secretion system target) [Flavobacterium aquicola]